MKPAIPPSAWMLLEIDRTMTKAMIAQIGNSRPSGRVVRHGSAKPRIRSVRPAPADRPDPHPEEAEEHGEKDRADDRPDRPTEVDRVARREQAEPQPDAAEHEPEDDATEERAAERLDVAAWLDLDRLRDRRWLGRRRNLERDDRTLRPVLVGQEDRDDVDAKGVAGPPSPPGGRRPTPRAARCRRSGSRARSARRASASLSGSARSGPARHAPGPRARSGW